MVHIIHKNIDRICQPSPASSGTTKPQEMHLPHPFNAVTTDHMTHKRNPDQKTLTPTHKKLEIQARQPWDLNPGTMRLSVE